MRYRYLIIGGGMSAHAAARGIRELDRDGSIAILSSETHPPYNRPLLSKGLWKGKPLERIWLRHEKLNLDLHLGRTVKALDLKLKQAVDGEGQTYSFDKLLLATGGRPRRLDNDRVIYFRTLDDYLALRDMTEQHREFLVIGGGFIGSEIAAALASNGKQVTLVFPEAGIGARIFPPGLSGFLNQYYREKGVKVIPGCAVKAVEAHNGRFRTHLDHGDPIDTDGVIAGLGISPNSELAEQAGLPADNGIEVDLKLRTGHPDVYAAGDVARFYNPALGISIRVEHEDNALTQGRLAGRNMAGAEEEYTHLPFFYSDLFELGYEAVGELDPRQQVVEDWEEPYRRGVVYYLSQGRVRGVLLWNVWGALEAARELISQPGPFQPADLKGRIQGKS
ncbi:MAG: N-acylamino acid racemase [Gemmatimonadales bacterium]|nr:MAG: N-acylamino acid racemase [Gemmatimonadales bacterium]